MKTRNETNETEIPNESPVDMSASRERESTGHNGALSSCSCPDPDDCCTYCDGANGGANGFECMCEVTP